MGKKCRDIRGKWSQENLTNAIDAIKDGMSQRLAETTYKIPRRTLRNHLKSGCRKKSLGRKSVLTVDQENSLVKRIIRFSDVGMPVTKTMLASYTYEFCKRNSLANSFSSDSCIAGRYWLKAFMKRNPSIVQRTAQHMNPARAQKLNRFIVNDHFDKLEKVMAELQVFDKPDRLYNMDEKGCQLGLHHQKQVLAGKGSKRVHLVAPEHSENVTIVACGNAMGNAIPPMIIFKGIRRRPELIDDLPPCSAVEMAPKGYMTTSIFILWLQHFAKYKPVGNVLLVFDGAASHLDPSIVDEAEKHSITLFCLPSNTTHELQPMDKSVFRAFESYWDEEVLKYWRQHPDRSLTKDRFGKIFTPVWNKSMSRNNIINGFKATGIYPFDKNVIPEHAFAPSSTTEISAEDAGPAEMASATETLAVCLPATTATSAEDAGRAEMASTTDILPAYLPASSSHTLTSMATLEEITMPVESPSTSITFLDLMPTPKINKKTQKKRRKSLNYTATVVSKKLFINEQEEKRQASCSKHKLKVKRDEEVTSKLKVKRRMMQSANKSKSENLKEKAEDDLSKVKHRVGGRRSQKEKRKESKLIVHSLKRTKCDGVVRKGKGTSTDRPVGSWYCIVCREDKQLSMTVCGQCGQWLHDECIGLDPDRVGNETFVCPYCDD